MRCAFKSCIAPATCIAVDGKDHVEALFPVCDKHYPIMMKAIRTLQRDFNKWKKGQAK